MSILAMTRELGSLGTRIGLEVAKRMGYRFIRPEITTQAAQVYEAAEEKLIASVESKPGLWESLGEAARRHHIFVASEVYDFAETGNIVIIGRWATLLLREVSHALRVRICAPLELRVRRVMKRRSLDQEDALRLIKTADEGARARIRQFFDVEWGDPLLYDLIINTEKIPLETAVAQIISLLQSPEFQPTEASLQKLKDLTLAARVKAVLKTREETTRLNINVVSNRAHITLEGIVFSDQGKYWAEKVARDVEGVSEVKNQLRVGKGW